MGWKIDMPLAVRNFGHFWNRENVIWGTRGKGNQGSLSGYRTVSRVVRVTDFRDQIGIYVLFDEKREVVYIGQTGSGERRLFLRLRDHTRDHLRDRWSYFSWFGFRQVKNGGDLSEAQKPGAKIQGNGSDALDEIESILLQLFEPRLNKQGPRWGKTEEYLQYVEFDEEIDPMVEVNEKLAEISAKMEK